MMPGTDFQACLETPHLFKASFTADSIAGDLAQAQELLKTAAEKSVASPAGVTCDPADVSLLSYRTMYTAAKALVHHAGYQCSNFRCLVSALNALFVDTKRLDSHLVDQLLAAQALTGEAPDHFKAAEAFVAKAASLTGSPSR